VRGLCLAAYSEPVVGVCVVTGWTLLSTIVFSPSQRTHTHHRFRICCQTPTTLM